MTHHEALKHVRSCEKCRRELYRSKQYGKLGGEAVKQAHGPDYYKRIGKKGGRPIRCLKCGADWGGKLLKVDGKKLRECAACRFRWRVRKPARAKP